jgi:D-alanyl-D-alanine carboxypeptidase
MQRSRFWLLVPVLAAVALLSARGIARLDQALPAGTLEQQADAIAGAALREGPVPGLSIAIAREGRALVAKGYGLANVELEAPATASTVYRIGSITKQFTAAAIMRLVEAGKMTLDDPIEKYLSDFPTSGRRITVRHLLTHTSGIKSYTSLGPKFWDISRLDYPHDKLVALFKDEPPDFQPGEKFLYNNSGYYLLGVILERVTGESYASHMRKTIFEPLGLSATTYCDLEPIVKHRAAGYDVKLGVVSNAAALSMKPPFSAGALCSTVGDLVTWTAALMDAKVIGSSSLEQMTRPATLNDGKPTTYGFGLGLNDRNGRRVIAHGGGINGFSSYLAYVPSTRLTVVVLTNSTNGKAGELGSALLKAARSASN